MFLYISSEFSKCSNNYAPTESVLGVTKRHQRRRYTLEVEMGKNALKNLNCAKSPDMIFTKSAANALQALYKHFCFFIFDDFSDNTVLVYFKVLGSHKAQIENTLSATKRLLLCCIVTQICQDPELNFF